MPLREQLPEEVRTRTRLPGPRDGPEAGSQRSDAPHTMQYVQSCAAGLPQSGHRVASEAGVRTWRGTGGADAIRDPFRFVNQRATPKTTMIATTTARSTRGITSTLTWDGCWMLEKMKIVSVIRKNATRDRGESQGTECSCPPPSFQFKKMNRLAFAP